MDRSVFILLITLILWSSVQRRCPCNERGKDRKDSSGRIGMRRSFPLVYSREKNHYAIFKSDWIVVNRIRSIESELLPNKDKVGWTDTFRKLNCSTSYIVFVKVIRVPLGASIITIQGWWLFSPESCLNNPITGECVSEILFVTDPNGVGVIRKTPNLKVETIVVAKELVIIDSTFDWELRMRHKCIPCPKIWRIPGNAIEALQSKQ